jgi:hypothetical protein
MTSEMREKPYQELRYFYQAVRCFYCAKPIRLSTRLLELHRVGFECSNAELRYQSQVFILRCDSCTRELHYLKSEIETFEGEPPKRGAAN